MPCRQNTSDGPGFDLNQFGTTSHSLTPGVQEVAAEWVRSVAQQPAIRSQMRFDDSDYYHIWMFDFSSSMVYDECLLSRSPTAAVILAPGCTRPLAQCMAGNAALGEDQEREK